MIIELKTVKEETVQGEFEVQKKVAGSGIVTAYLRGKCDCYG